MPALGGGDRRIRNPRPILATKQDPNKPELREILSQKRKKEKKFLICGEVLPLIVVEPRPGF